jgi:hypothetical protein
MLLLAAALSTGQALLAAQLFLAMPCKVYAQQQFE